VGNSTESGFFALGRTRATISRVTRRGARLLVCSLLPFAAAACSPSPAPSPLAGRDLILVNVDALRADHLGCYGYARDTSPFLDSLCREGVVFERASAGSSYTRESVAALFTGLLPSKSGAIGWNAAPPPARATLAERLRRHGYRTGFLSNTVMLQNPGFPPLPGSPRPLRAGAALHPALFRERVTRSTLPVRRRRASARPAARRGLRPRRPALRGPGDALRRGDRGHG
jgi:hypothetical protein